MSQVHINHIRVKTKSIGESEREKVKKREKRRALLLSNHLDEFNNQQHRIAFISLIKSFSYIKEGQFALLRSFVSGLSAACLFVEVGLVDR